MITLRLLLGAATTIRAQSCSVTALDPCPTARDGTCDNPASCVGTCSDYFDCQIYRATAITCTQCVAGGGAWCLPAATCMSSVQPPANLMHGDALLCHNASMWTTSSCLPPPPPFNDPAYGSQQWVYDLINVRPAWSAGYNGTGVQIVFNDDGIDLQHEFGSFGPGTANPKFDVHGSCLGTDLHAATATHGTATAAIAAGNANSFCSVGIAHGARIAGCPNLAAPTPPNAIWFALERNDISSNSWGIDICRALQRRRKLAGQADSTGASRQRRKLTATCPFLTNITQTLRYSSDPSATPYQVRALDCSDCSDCSDCFDCFDCS